MDILEGSFWSVEFFAKGQEPCTHRANGLHRFDLWSVGDNGYWRCQDCGADVDPTERTIRRFEFYPKSADMMERVFKADTND